MSQPVPAECTVCHGYDSSTCPACLGTGQQPAQPQCTVCQQPMHWIDCPTGGWWRHDQHPTDDHDAKES